MADAEITQATVGITLSATAQLAGRDEAITQAIPVVPITFKSGVFDIADNWLSGGRLGVRQIDFERNGVKLPLVSTDYTAYSTSEDGADYVPANAFDTSLSKIGNTVDNGFRTLFGGFFTNQRLIIVLNTPQEIDKIIINNYHDTGGIPSYGIKNTVITVSDDAITNTTYNAAIANSTELFDGEIAQHPATDTVDDVEYWTTSSGALGISAASQGINANILQATTGLTLSITAGHGAGVTFDTAQTPAAVVLSATAQDVYAPEVFRDVASVTNPDPLVVEGFYASDSAIVSNPVPTIHEGTEVLDTAELNDYVYPTAHYTKSLLEIAVLDDNATASVGVVEDILETAVVTDEATRSDLSLSVLETAALGDAVTITVGTNILVLETAELNDYVYPAQTVSVLETAALGDSARVYLDAIIVHETAELNDYISNTANLIECVSETAELNDYVSTQMFAMDVVYEEAYISSEAYPDNLQDRNDIFTANTVNWAMSMYTGLTLTGKSGVFAVSPEGLYQESTADANGLVETGHLNLGSNKLKSMRYAYVYAEHSSPLNITVTADVNGAEQDYEYEQMARDATDTRAVRCSFGRGFRSSYYKLKLESEGYAKMQEVIPIVAETYRRI